MEKNHEYWMRLALEEAKAAMEIGEIPVATIIVAGGKELARGQTQVKRRESIVAHGELFALLDVKNRIFTADRPIILYTTLEPCLMCLGATMQTGVDEIVFAMDAAPDGGTRYVDDILKGGQAVPKITAHILEDEEIALMKEFLERFPDSPAAPYVKDLLKPYVQEK